MITSKNKNKINTTIFYHIIVTSSNLYSYNIVMDNSDIDMDTPIVQFLISTNLNLNFLVSIET